jgi:hypothetical protein
LIFSIVVGGFLIYDGGKGYKVYRYEKSLYERSTKVVQDNEQKEVPILDEEQEQDTVVS